MRLLQPLFYLLFICTTTHTDGQWEHAQHRNNPLYFSNKIFVKAAPLSVFDPIGANLPVAIEYSFARSWGVQVGYGISFHTINGFIRNHIVCSTPQNIHSDNAWHFELRKYVRVRERYRGIVGFELIKRHQNISEKNGTIWDDRLYSYNYSSADIDKSLTFYGFFAGSETMLTNNLFFEFHAGLGYFIDDVKHYNVMGQSTPYTDKFNHIGIENTSIVDGKKDSLYPSVNVSIAYLLGHR